MQIAALLAVLFTAAAAADGVHDGATKTAPSADEEDFLDVRQLVKNSIYALTQLPKTSSDYNKTAEDLMRLLQLPADIILTGSAPADPTTTPQSARSRSDADASPFRQLSSWEEEENAQREEEKKKAELQKRIEAETRLLEEVRRKAEAQRKIADAARKRILESGGMMPETADTTTTTTTTTTEKPPPTAAPGPRSRARPTFLDDLKALQKFFGTPVSASSPLSSVLSSSSAPSVLPAISRGLPTPQYAYQPIVQPDGRTYYQQVLIVPSSMPFPAPDLANTSSVVDSRTLDPAIPEAKKSAVNYSAELKTDDHKTLQKKHSKRFRTYSSKTVHASPSSAQSPEKAEAEEDGPAEKEAFKMVSKNGSELITTKLPSADEQRKAAEIFGEEARHPQASTAPSASKAKSPVYLSSSVFHVQKEKKLRKKLKRKNPMKSNGQDDDSSPPVKRRRSWRREIHRSKSAEKTTTTETPSTSSSASSGVDAMEDTLPERKMGHSLRKMRRLRIRHRPESAEARIPRPSPNDDDDDDVSRAADAIERELVQATREAQKSSRRRRKKLRKKHRKSRTTHMSTMRIDDVKISAQADPIRRQPPIASVAMPTFNEVFKQMEEQDARPVSVEDSSRRLESIEQRLKSAKAISKRKVVPRKGVPVTEPPSLDDFLQAAGDEAAMLGEDLSREVDRILHEGRVRRNKGHWVLDEAAAQTQPPQKAPSSSSASAETLLARKKRKRRTRRMKKYIPKYLTTPQTPTTTTTTTTTTTPTTTTTTSTAGQEEIESGISPNELVNIETSFPSDIRVTRKHCWNIRSFAWQHGMTDVTDYALSNCGYIENYYPDLPCSRAEEYMVYCRQYYKEV